MMFEEAVKQGKHIFMEKPVAIDAAASPACSPPRRKRRRRT